MSDIEAIVIEVQHADGVKQERYKMRFEHLRDAQHGTFNIGDGYHLRVQALREEQQS